jgi:hypothetical protein
MALTAEKRQWLDETVATWKGEDGPLVGALWARTGLTRLEALLYLLLIKVPTTPDEDGEVWKT